MHYYKRNLGDYAKKAGRLTMLQHGSYTLLIDSCYDRETFPTLEQALEWTWASTEAEVEAVKFVLSRFFVLDKDGCYVQDRILQELLEYHAKADTNKRIAIERETKRKQKNTNREQDVDESTPNHKPITNNQEPKKKATVVACPDGVGEDVWQDWLQLRKAKKAPVTQTVVNSATKEAEKAGISLNAFLTIWCARGSQGLQAEWLKTNERQPFANKYDVAGITTPPPPNQDAALRKIEEDRKKAVPPSLETLAKLAELRKSVTP
jgi:uncharacterized protein YdaU (DUF1376 family)